MLIAGALATYANRQRTVLGNLAFALLMLAIAEWSAGYALEISGADLATKVFWGQVQYLGIVLAPVAWLVFTLRYSQLDRWVTPASLAGLGIVPVLTVLLVVVAPQNGLVWAGVQLDDSGPFLALVVDHGPWFWVHTAYSYLALLIGTVLLIRTSLRHTGLYRWQVAAMITGALVPWAGNFLVLSGINPWAPLDLTPFAFTLTGAALSLGIFQFRLLDLTPIAREVVVEAMSDGMLVLDRHDRIVDINPAAARLAGVSTASAISQPLGLLFTEWAFLLQRPPEQGEASEEVSLGKGATRRHYQLRLSPLSDRRQRSVGRVLIIHDITGRKRAEEVQRRDVEWMHALYNITLDFLNHREIDDLLQTIVERAAVLLDAPLAEIMLLDGDELVVRAFSRNQPFLAGDRVKRDEARLSWQAVLSKRVAAIDDYAVWPHRRAVYDSVSLHAAASIPILMGDKCLGVLDLGRTDLKHPFDADQLQIAELLAQLAAVVLNSAQLYVQSQEANRLKSRLLANISHDVRTPLGAILGYTEMLQVGVYGAISEQQAGALTEIVASTNLLLDFVNNLIGQSEIETGKVALHRQPFSPAGLLDVLQSTARVLARAKGLELKAEVAPDLPAGLLGDAYRLRQILLNLLSNAIKFTAQGAITVRLLRPDAGHWAIQVSDTGPGIPPEAQADIFQAFWKGEGGLGQQPHMGSGLGLAVVKELTALMDGQISLESAVGQGSTFTVTLPLVPATQAENVA